MPNRRESGRSQDSAQSETFQTIGRLSTRGSQSQGVQKQAPPEGSRGTCWCCARRRKVPLIQQTVVILRHSERKDYVDPTYKTSEEGLAWPHDAPLTEKGIELAKEVAEEMALLHDQEPFAAIASSPYRRCLETAAEVAKALQLPVVIDQELGEVRDRAMPQETVAHRSPKELKNMARSLGIRLLNPVEEESGVKIFGKEPVWPENLEAAKNRYIVRIETYIRQSAQAQQNMILVTHADAVAAALVMFERGGADIQNMGFCARVIAKRLVPKKISDEEHGVYAEHWDVDYKGFEAEILHDEAMARYNERMYLETCADTQQMVNERHRLRTKTDFLFDDTFKDLLKNKIEEQDD